MTSKFEQFVQKILEAVEVAPAPTTRPTAPPSQPKQPSNPIRRPAPGRKSKPKALKKKEFFDKLRQKYNL